ncbi:MAG: hypothetical protein M3Y39_02430 [Chloroflexota bacterium]|nr:hypothetical protein [Chloroflexota bacterium]
MNRPDQKSQKCLVITRTRYLLLGCVFLAACLIWNVPEMIGALKQTAKASRKEHRWQRFSKDHIVVYV